MPELPEVETARRLTEAHLVGRSVTDIAVTLPKLLRQSILPDPGILTGRTLTGAARRGKVLHLAFDGDLSLLIHFKLAGQWAVLLHDGTRRFAGHPVPKPTDDLPHKSTHARIDFSGGARVWYSDIRQFGWWNVLPTGDVPEALARLGLGPEATESIDVTRLAQVLARRSVPVKAVLLDQTVLAGLGNIYVDEALFAVGIHPARPARSLDTDEVTRLAAVIPGIMAEGIRQGGATIIHGKAVPDRKFPAVHGREGEACFRCGSIIIKSRVAGRGTYTCPTCQPKPD